MTRRSLNRACVLCLAVALGLAVSAMPVAAQDAAGSAPEASGSGPAPEASGSGPANPVAKIESIAQSKTMLRVHLAIDRNLPGRVVRAANLALTLAPGQAEVSLAPVGNTSLRAKISFLQDGQIVNEVMSDESGRFQVVGLQPGVYTVVAVGRGASGIVAVEVLPYEANLSKELTVLTIPLDELALAELDALAPVPEGALPMMYQTAAGGGVGGGGGAGMGLAGLAAGLGGLAAGLAGGGAGGGGPASPAIP